MILEIKQHNHLYKVIGTLEKQNINEFKSRFKDVFKNSDAITICIENLKRIDQYGVNALAELHNESLKKQKKLSIIGLGCKELYQHFKTKRKQQKSPLSL